MAPKKGHLKVASGDERPAKPKNITEALAGSRSDVLVAMREALAKKLDANEVSSNSIASAYKELDRLDAMIRQASDAEADELDTSGADERFDSSAI